ncbi:type II toxin-antitoxin system YafQ family toxin [Secundilactobacillus kimchicus]|uniref:type II toxin-antitoxin system YafQ family toxin n=1 Tax=Secundilactobacillus kimchicus TaxID=528209 RepID=UPI0006E1D0CA|nr:type II toxin-antitoxin system YafQ family toxin [Secundilactobacillus kimchicus]
MNKRQVYFTGRFKREYKRVKRDSRWNPVFNERLPFDDKRSPWQYVIACLIYGKEIPDYFYAHQLKGFKKEIQEIKRSLRQPNATVRILELHFDGYNGDHLMIYSVNDNVVHMLAIGTHSNLFK